MKKRQTSKARSVISDDLRPEYDFDFSQSRPNRFANRPKDDRVVIVLDPDIGKVFTNSEAVNNVLRALLSNMPQPHMQKTSLRSKV